MEYSWFLEKRKAGIKKEDKRTEKTPRAGKKLCFFLSKTEGTKWREETMFFLDVPGTHRPGTSNQENIPFLRGKGMFLCFWARKKAPVEML